MKTTDGWWVDNITLSGCIYYLDKYSYVVSGSELKSFELTTLMPTDLSLIATYNSSKGDKEFEVIVSQS